MSRADDSAFLLSSIFSAPFTLFVSPIFFYHLPAGFKALIDRMQLFWSLREAKDPRLEALPEQRFGAVLCAGRPKGERLFEGALLTLRWAMKSLNQRLEEPLLLRGLDAAGDLAANPEARDAVRAYAETCKTWCGC